MYIEIILWKCYNNRRLLFLFIMKVRLIGQKVCVKTLITLDIY